MGLRVYDADLEVEELFFFCGFAVWVQLRQSL